MTALGVMTAVVNAAFLLASLAALRLWFRHRSRPAAWLAATFGALATVIVASWFIQDGVTTGSLLIRLLVLALLAAPYLLFRFADSVAPAPPWARRLGNGLAVAVVLTTLAIRPFPDVESSGALGLVGWTYQGLLLASWAGWSIGAGWLLVRRSLGEPSVVRHRLRVLATAALGLGVVIPAMSLVETDTSLGAQLTIEGFSALLGVLFLVGFAPPAALRSAWRHVDEQRLYDAAVGFLSATRPDEISAVLVPGVRRVLGAESVVLRDASGRVLYVDGPLAQQAAGATRIRRPLGTRTLDVTLSAIVPLFGDDEQGQLDRLALLADLAFERTRLLEAEHAARTKLERVNAELESFVYTTSHDLKNPVLAVLGYLDVISEDHAHELSAELRRHLERVAVNARHMESLIRDLLELSRVGRVDAPPEDVDLSALVDDVTDDLVAAHPGLRVVRGDLPMVRLNATRARQVVTNLLENAARYGGRDEVTVEIEAGDGGDGVRLTFSDDGQGIPPAHLERIFGVFERLDPDVTTGTGMGLAICRRVVETAGGRMVAEPSDGGARFVIDLPAAAPVVSATTTEPASMLQGSAP